MKKRLVALAALALLFSACEADDDDPPVSGGDDRNDVFNRHYLPDGDFVWCLTSDSGGGQGKIRGMSCDWVDYHLRQGVTVTGADPQ